MTKSWVFGTTAIGLPILAYRWEAKGAPEILVLGGVHGDETEGVVCAYGIYRELCREFKLKLNLTLVPAFNLDGVLAKTRLNGNGVDLNRNLPTQDWNPQAFNERYPPGLHANSEPENQALTAYLESPSAPIRFEFAFMEADAQCQRCLPAGSTSHSVANRVRDRGVDRISDPRLSGHLRWLGAGFTDPYV